MAAHRPTSRSPLLRTWMPASMLILSTLLAPTGKVSAEVLDANLWVTDGDVKTVVPWGNTLYIGGSFAYVGPNTGGWTALDASGRAVARLPRVNGDVRVTESDGAGGWWIGGGFTKVAGLARPGLAHVLADGSVATWMPSPAPSGLVTCLAHQGSRVFVATDQLQLRAYDAVTGAQIGGWSPAVSGQVNSLVVNGTTLYAGGGITFTITSPASMGTGIAAIDVNTGSIANWDPAPDGDVTKLYAEGRWLHVTGNFTEIGGQSHAGLARAALATGDFDAGWTPSLDAPVTAFARIGGGLWIGGNFFFVNGGFVMRLAVVDTTTGATTGPTPSLGSLEGQVTAMAVHSSYLYLGITPTFTYAHVQSSRPLVVRMDATTGVTETAWQAWGLSVPTSDVGSVTSLQLSPAGELVAAGHFVSLGGRRQRAVAALDRTSGQARNWDPQLTVDELFPTVPSVGAILPTPHAIYLGGYFTKAFGQTRKSLVAVDSVTAGLRPWQADLGPSIPMDAGLAGALALVGDKILVGGGFSAVAGEAHTSLALVDSVVGTPVAGWSCDAVGSVNCLLVQGGTAYVGGGFSSLGGQARNNLAAITASTGALLPSWNPNVAGVQVWTLATSNDTMYVGGDYSQVGGQSRVCLAAVGVSSGALLGWAPSAFGPVRAMLIQGPNLLVGGEFGFLAGQPLPFLGRVDRFTGALVSGAPAVDEAVYALASEAGGGATFVAGGFGQFAQAPTAFLARTFGADATGPTLAVVRANGGEYLAIGSTYRFEYTASDPSGVTSVDLELSRSGGGGPWTTIAAGLPNTGGFDWVVTAPAVTSNAFLRLTARDFADNTATDLSDAAFSIGDAVAGVDGVPRNGLSSLSLGPNPARLETELRFTLGEPSHVRLRLLDVQGRVVWAAPGRLFGVGAHALPCTLGGFAPGLYFLNVERGSEVVTTRLVIVR